jgi:hypothetical protein
MPRFSCLISAGIITILLSGCGSFCKGYTAGGTRNMNGGCGRVTKNVLEQERLEQQERKRAELQRQADMGNQCAAYGFQQNTSEFAQCLMRLDQAERDRQAEAERETARAFNEWQRAERERVEAERLRNIQTDCTEFGRTISCTSKY